MVRGKTYTFVVEGGNNPDIPAKYHPFYISDDPVGGYEHKREEEKKVSSCTARKVLQLMMLILHPSLTGRSHLCWRTSIPFRASDAHGRGTFVQLDARCGWTAGR